MKKKPDGLAWVVKDSEGVVCLYVGDKPPDYNRYRSYVCKFWQGADTDFCYGEWLSFTGLRLRKDKPVRVRITAEEVKA